MAPTSYATVEDVVADLSKPETDTRILARIATALNVTTDRLTQELRFDFFRHPSGEEYEEGDEIRLFDAVGGDLTDRGRLLHIHTGFVSVTTIKIRASRLDDWVTLDPADYDLEAWAAADPSQTVATIEPFDHIRFNGTGTYTTFYRGRRSVEITGVFGWPAVPTIAKEANVAWTRQTIAADRTYPGGVISPDEDGRPVLPSRTPDIVMRLKQWSLERYSCAT